MNVRQVKLLNRLLDGFEGKLTTSKWAVMGKCSPDTALRDINELLSYGVLRKAPAGGRSTSYDLGNRGQTTFLVTPGACEQNRGLSPITSFVRLIFKHRCGWN
jgi:DeoR/GlpR family transcriptional regulator of sugar metabolism